MSEVILSTTTQVVLLFENEESVLRTFVTKNSKVPSGSSESELNIATVGTRSLWLPEFQLLITNYSAEGSHIVSLDRGHNRFIKGPGYASDSRLRTPEIPPVQHDVVKKHAEAAMKAVDRWNDWFLKVKEEAENHLQELETVAPIMAQ